MQNEKLILEKPTIVNYSVFKRQENSFQTNPELLKSHPQGRHLKYSLKPVCKLLPPFLENPKKFSFLNDGVYTIQGTIRRFKRNKFGEAKAKFSWSETLYKMRVISVNGKEKQLSIFKKNKKNLTCTLIFRHNYVQKSAQNVEKMMGSALKIYESYARAIENH
ncbi:MAG: hypothetical protein Q7K42_06275, partial [Candidatus Diapherotrites archaeon]|nr:hypothetical protein [Candidatus Diapherotrites archaeon]